MTAEPHADSESRISPDLQIRREPIAALADYGEIPIGFEVRSELSLELAPEAGGFGLREVRVAPWFKDYDLAGNRPTDWAQQFDMSPWQRLGAFAGAIRVGAALLVYASPELHLLEDRADLAVLWDIRVSPDWRGRGVGQALFRAAAELARAGGCRQLKVETQNVNVPACRFYLRMGCELGAIHRFAYADFPREVQLLWYKTL